MQSNHLRWSAIIFLLLAGTALVLSAAYLWAEPMPDNPSRLVSYRDRLRSIHSGLVSASSARRVNCSACSRSAKQRAAPRDGQLPIPDVASGARV
jgi:hypothetical protein